MSGAALAGLPPPLAGHLAADAATGAGRLVLCLPPKAWRGDAAFARWTAPTAESPLLLRPLAIEASAAGVGVLYRLPERARPRGRGTAAAAPSPALSTLGDLLAAAGSTPCARPELLALLVLAGALAALRALHERGDAHGMLWPGFLVLAGAPPERLLAECPRDPAVRLLGCGLATALAPAAYRIALAADGGRFRAPELAALPAGAAPSLGALARVDLWAAAALVRALLATQVCEPPETAAPGSVAARLHDLLARLLAADPARRPAAAAAAVECRELAVRALAEWDRGRQGAMEQVRYAAPPRRQRGGGGSQGRGARAGDRSFPAPPAVAPPGPARLVAVAREPSDARTGPPVAPAVSLEAPLPAGLGGHGPAWMALAPSLLAGALVLLLAVTLLLGP